MSTRRLLQAALCGALALAATPVHAQSFDAELRTWGRALDAAGVRVLDDTSCPRGIVARYLPRIRSIQLCDAAARSESFFIEAITHEAVHAAQHCLALRRGDRGFRPITLELNENNPELARQFFSEVRSTVASKYVPDQGNILDQTIENEAYALETQPTAVRDMLQRACS